MHPDVAALLAVQAEDDIVDGIVNQLDAIAPRLTALDAVRAKAVKSIADLRLQLDADEKKRVDMAHRLSEHKQRQERNVAQLDVVKRMREATAAVTQVEMGRKILLELDNGVRDIVARIADARQALEQQEAELERLDLEQADARAAIRAEQGVLEESLAVARAARDQQASGVAPSLRAKYDRIRARRRAQSVFSLESGACGSCDTAVPIQRRNSMASSGAIDVCEACGVLIYARE